MEKYEATQIKLIQDKYKFVECLLSNPDSMFKYLNYDIVEHIQKMAIKAFIDSKVINYMGIYYDARDNEIPTHVNGDGDKYWKLSDGDWHRINDLPAVIKRDGTLLWARYDLIHRRGDKPAVIYCNGTSQWLIDGETHRDYDLPAAIYEDGTRMWFNEGDFHRANGKPAIIYPDGEVEYWEYGVQKMN
jgi:hypothetical protein